MEVPSTRVLAATRKDSQGPQTQGRFEKPSQSRDRTNDVTWPPVRVPETEKKTLSENQGNLNRVGTLHNDNALTVARYR